MSRFQNKTYDCHILHATIQQKCWSSFSKSNGRPVDFDLSLDASSAQAEDKTSLNLYQLVYLITQHPKPTPYFTFALDKVSGTQNNKQSFKSSSLSILTMTFRWSRVFHPLGNRHSIRYSNDPPMGKNLRHWRSPDGSASKTCVAAPLRWWGRT